MKRITKEHLLILLALAVGWIAHDVMTDAGVTMPLLPQAAAQSPTLLAQDDTHARLMTASDDGLTITIWTFSMAKGNILSTPSLTSTKVFSAK